MRRTLEGTKRKRQNVSGFRARMATPGAAVLEPEWLHRAEEQFSTEEEQKVVTDSLFRLKRELSSEI